MQIYSGSNQKFSSNLKINTYMNNKKNIISKMLTYLFYSINLTSILSNSFECLLNNFAFGFVIELLFRN